MCLRVCVRVTFNWVAPGWLDVFIWPTRCWRVHLRARPLLANLGARGFTCPNQLIVWGRRGLRAKSNRVEINFACWRARLALAPNRAENWWLAPRRVVGQPQIDTRARRQNNNNGKVCASGQVKGSARSLVLALSLAGFTSIPHFLGSQKLCFCGLCFAAPKPKGRTLVLWPMILVAFGGRPAARPDRHIEAGAQTT